MRNVLVLGAFLLFGACAFPTLAAQDAASFRDAEYLASTGLDSINAAEAYARGFTGAGVVLGISDSGVLLPTHVELADKEPHGNPWGVESVESHATHVAGIAAAARNGAGMQGVAFNAKLLSLGLQDVPDLDDGPYSYLFPFDGEGLPQSMDPANNVAIAIGRTWLEYLNYPDIKVINASLGVNIWQDTFQAMTPTDRSYWRSIMTNFPGTLNLLGANDKLLVISSGNEGHDSPALLADLPGMFAEANIAGGDLFKNNYIAVGSFNPRYESTAVGFISSYSNMGKDSSSFILAPGESIYSTVEYSDTAYASLSGTSMAAPHVTGTAGLVQQAFPYMGGKQLADVILSTATPLTSANRPHVFMLREQSYESDATTLIDVVPVFYSDDPDLPKSLTQEERNILLRQYLTYGDSNNSVAANTAIFNDALDDYLLNYQPMSSDDYGALFGHGVLDAGKAVRGPGYFDARRLDKTRDLLTQTQTLDGNAYAMYGVNTQGYDSVWSNDIGQHVVQDPANALNNLDVGLHKQGEGLLVMSGVNTYRGPTLIDGGGIALSGPDSRRPELASPYVQVGSQGLLTGNGILLGDLYNQGDLIPGNVGEGNGMDVRGDFAMPGGTFHSLLYADGTVNQLRVDGDVVVSGGDLNLYPAMANGDDFFNPYSSFDNLIVNTSGKAMSVDFGESISLSAFISFAPVVANNRYSLANRTVDLDKLPGMAPEVNNVARDLQGMFGAFAGSAAQQRLYYLYFLDRNAFGANTAMLRGDVHAATLSQLSLGNVLPKLLAEDPVGDSLAADTAAVLSSGRALASARAAAPGSGISLWAKPLLNYGTIDGKESVYQDSTQVNGYGVVLGGQRSGGNIYYGAMAGLAHNRISLYHDKANANDFRLGLYGGWRENGLRMAANLAGGYQYYRTKRIVPQWTATTTLRSDYDGYSLSAGGYLGYNVLEGVANNFELTPSFAVAVDHIDQDGRRESGDDLFALAVRGGSLTRTSLLPSIDFKARVAKSVALDLGVGYKRIVGGHNPALAASFVGFGGGGFQAIGPRDGKDFLTAKASLEIQATEKCAVALGVYNETSAKSRQWIGFANVAFTW